MGLLQIGLQAKIGYGSQDALLRRTAGNCALSQAIHRYCFERMFCQRLAAVTHRVEEDGFLTTTGKKKNNQDSEQPGHESILNAAIFPGNRF